MCIHAHTRIHTYTHTHMHTCTYTHTHTYTRIRVSYKHIYTGLCAFTTKDKAAAHFVGIYIIYMFI